MLGDIRFIAVFNIQNEFMQSIKRLKALDEQLSQFAGRTLDEAYPYLIVDARYEKVRESGAIRSRAVLIAIGR